MVEERRLAQKHSYPSPIHDTLEDTHQAYNESISFMMDNIREGDKLFVATHNVDSVKMAREKIDSMPEINDKVYFGQLKGFSD